MSARTTLRPYPVFSSVSMAADATSAVTVLQSLSKISYGVSWTGTSPVGVLYTQVSNDYSLNQDGSVHNSGTWNNLPSSNAISGNTGNGFIDVETGAYAIRLFYDATSGVGSISATVSGKVA